MPDIEPPTGQGPDAEQNFTAPLQPDVISSSSDVAAPDKFTQPQVLSPNEIAIQNEENRLKRADKAATAPATLQPAYASAGNRRIDDDHILRTSTPAPQTLPTPRRGTDVGSADHTKGRGILGRLTDFLGRHKREVAVATAVSVGGTLVGGAALDLSQNNGEHQPGATVPAIGIGDRSPQPNQTIVVQTPSAPSFATTEPPATATNSPDVTITPNPTSTEAPSPTATITLTPSPTATESAAPEDPLQQNLDAWVNNQSQPAHTWMYGSDSAPFGFWEHVTEKGYDTYLGYMLGAKTLSNGEAIIYIGMVRKDGKPYFVPFRAGVGSYNPVGNVEINYTDNTQAVGGDNGTAEVVDPSAYASQVNSSYQDYNIMLFVPNTSTGWEEPLRELVTDAELSANKALKNWAISGSHAPWFVNNRNIDETNFNTVPTFPLGIAPSSLYNK